MKPDIVAQIKSDIQNIAPFDKTEVAHIADALAWIDSAPNIFRIAKPDKPPKHLVSYFVLIDPEHKSLLLGDHIKAQLWLPSGGHVEFNEPPRTTVVRECQEELGQDAVFLKGNDRPFFVTVTQTVGLTAGHTDVSLWYLLRGNKHDTLHFDRREFTDMNWFTFDEILASHPAIFDPHMQRFTHKLKTYLA
jgi:8-oxo-dGTP pyrophosphatase MutT (NUDIX family)